MIDKKALFELIKFKTFNPNKEEKEKAAKWLKNYLENKGFEVEIVYSENETPNILAKKGEKGKRLVFVTHYDVVPPGEGWEFDPFKPFEKDGKIFGRGSADDKGAVIATINGVKRAELNNQVILAIAGGEETQESEEFFDELKGDIVFVVDVGPYVSIGCSGFLGINIKIKGKQCHSAYPFLGDNAIYKLSPVLEKIKEISEFAEKNWKSKYVYGDFYRDGVPVRINPTKLEVKPNVINIIPGEANIYINARTVPEYNNELVFDYMKKQLEKLAKNNNIEITIEKDSLEMEPWVSEGEHVDKFIELVKDLLGDKKYLELGGTDGYHFYKKGMKVIQFGPMREENNIHGPNEWVYIKDLERVAEVVRREVEKF